MFNTLLSLLLTIQLSTPLPAADQPRCTPSAPHPQRVFFGMIDPELSLWFARVPGDTPGKVTWCWRWQEFLAALFSQPPVKEDANAPAL